MKITQISDCSLHSSTECELCLQRDLVASEKQQRFLLSTIGHSCELHDFWVWSHLARELQGLSNSVDGTIVVQGWACASSPKAVLPCKVFLFDY